MARSERTRSPGNGGASAGQRAVRSRPRWALRQDQPTPPDQAEFVLCEQTIFARSRPTVVTCCISDAPRAGGPFTTSTATLRCLSGRRPSHHNGGSRSFSPSARRCGAPPYSGEREHPTVTCCPYRDHKTDSRARVVGASGTSPRTRSCPPVTLAPAHPRPRGALLGCEGGGEETFDCLSLSRHAP